MKTKLLVKSLMLAGLLAIVCGFPMQAGALPEEPFSFHQHSGFLVDSPYLWSITGENSIGYFNQVVYPNPPYSALNAYDTIAWGASLTGFPNQAMGSDPWGNAAFSALKVISHAGTVTTGADPENDGTSLWGAWEAISTVYHQNNPIPGFSSTLLSAIIFSDLLIDHSGSGDIFESPDGIPIGFKETPNSGSCPDGNPNGSVCDDLFTFPAIGFANETFAYGNHKYEIQFGLDNFVSSATDFPVCSGDVCTVWTAEEVTSSMDVVMRIREVPEPASLLLLGLGLLGLGFAKRRGIKS